MRQTIIQTAEASHELRPLLESLAAKGVDPKAELIYRSRNRVFLYEYKGMKLCIKAFRSPSFPNNYIYTTYRESKARRSMVNSLRLRELGFDVPTPVGYAEVRDGHRLLESYYVCLALDGHTMRDWRLRDDADELLDEFAAYMLRLHRAGVFHRDFSPGNIIVTRDGKGQRHFNLIDVNRMRFDVHDKKELMRNFRAITLDPEELTVLARKYARAAGLDPEKLVAEAQAELAAYERSKRVHRFFKRLIGRQKKKST